MNKLLQSLIVLCLLIGNASASEAIPKLNIYMEVWYPFQYTDDQNITRGFAVDLLDLLLKDLNSTHSKTDFKFAPWARIVLNLKKTNTIALSMIRTPKREDRYQWVGPIYSVDNYVIVRKDSLLKKESFTSGNNEITTASIIGDASLHYLEELKVNPKNINVVTNIASPALMLNKNRVDVIVDNWFNFEEVAKKADLNISDFKRLINLGGNKTYFAVSRSTDPAIALQLQASLNKIRATTQYKELLSKYKLNIKTN